MDRRIIMGICTNFQKRGFAFRPLLPNNAFSNRVCACQNNWNSNFHWMRWKSHSPHSQKPHSHSSSSPTKLKKRRKESLDSLGTWDSHVDLPLQVKFKCKDLLGMSRMLFFILKNQFSIKRTNDNALSICNGC